MIVSVGDAIRATPEIVKALSEGERIRLARAVEREVGKRSTYYLTKYILGYHKLDDKLHLELCNFIDQHIYSNQFIMIPRKHYKTTCRTIGANIRLVLNHPEITIAILFDVIEHLEDVMREIKDHFILNDKFRELYPEHAVRGTKAGTKTRFTTPGRTRVKRMPTFTGFSVDKSIVSAHFDLVGFDDFVDEKNAVTDELRAKVWGIYTKALITSSTNQEGFKWNYIVGTPWHFDDLYARVKEQNEESGEYHFFHKPAEWKVTMPDGRMRRKVLFPSVWNTEMLDAERRRLGDFVYSCQYLCTPIPEGESAMDPDKLKFFDPETLKKENVPLNKMIFVDPASSVEMGDGDPNVIAAYGMDPESNIYCLDVRRIWPTLEELCDEIIVMQKLHHINRIGIEAEKLKNWLAQTLDRKRKEQGLYFKIEPIKRLRSQPKKGAYGRQEAIIGFLNEGKIHIRKDEPEIEIIRKELREYPHGRYDDWMDTLTDAINTLKPPPKRNRTFAPLQARIPPRYIRSRSHIQTGYSVTSVVGDYRS